ncbi:GNAT superfamily N-acetyltransferase [Actinokineospora baliensis]|uniref:GNAT family N-acetyltransferase n=1 Tax=Actinokineospora baliensis TaxID=547056 RepID=UPI00195C13CE|nr:GNAT family N-acetyltransferase [Actinokineospora baliensis]MBM7771608.1 GNAT superfamily N-acetyltransferase [Actinokineospora baliensis]
MQVRRARPGDGHGMGRVHVAAWRAGYQGIMGDDRLAGLSERTFGRRWESIVTSPGEVRNFVVERDRQIVAIGSAGPPRQPVAAGEVHMINVHPDAWGTGAGTAMLERLQDELRTLGYAQAYLWVADGNQRAIRFYANRGWSPDGEVMDDERESPPLRELRYVREL